MSNEYKQLSLKMSGQYDYQNGLAAKQTGWGVISQDRASKKISRKHRILTGKGKRGGKTN